MFKIGKSLIVAGLLVVASAQAADANLEATKGYLGQAGDALSSAAKSTGNALSSAANTTGTAITDGTKKAQKLASSGLETVTTNSSKLYKYLYELGVNGEVNTTKRTAIQCTKAGVVIAATAIVLCYAYSKVYGEEKKTITIGGDDIITVE